MSLSSKCGLNSGLRRHVQWAGEWGQEGDSAWQQRALQETQRRRVRALTTNAYQSGHAVARHRSAYARANKREGGRDGGKASARARKREN
eukprot:248283-Pleurochrysis_carterae.AAC.1